MISFFAELFVTVEEFINVDYTILVGVGVVEDGTRLVSCEGEPEGFESVLEFLQCQVILVPKVCRMEGGEPTIVLGG